MKAVAVSIWIFINLVFIGMCGYIYLLWSQYWLYVERQHNQFSPGNGNMVNSNNNGFITNNQIIYLQHGPSAIDPLENIYRNKTLGPLPRHHSSATVVRKESHPRFPNPRREDSTANVLKCNKDTGCANAVVDEPPPNGKTGARIVAHKNQLVVQLRRVLLEESSVFKARGDGSNPYGVRYVGQRTSYIGRSVREMVCELKSRARVRELAPEDEPFKTLGLGKQFPKLQLFEDGKIYNSCGIVSNAGSLYGAKLGQFIDAHDIVLRFNHAPTEGYEEDVGTKTTLRIVNSQVVTKPAFNFLNSSLYRDIKLLAWDPSNYTSTLQDWYKQPDFDLFTPYFKHRAANPQTEFHILDPRSLWTIWNYIQSHIPARIRRNPPSSGFLGLALLLPHCTSVDLFEYIPSVRMTKRCHYWDVAEDSACTFGVWHPLAAEKILSLSLNVASDEAVYLDGYIRVPGYSTLQC